MLTTNPLVGQSRAWPTKGFCYFCTSMSLTGINMKQKDYVLIRTNPVLKYMISSLPLDRHLLLEHTQTSKIEKKYMFTLFVPNNSQLVQNKWSFELCTSVIHEAEWLTCINSIQHVLIRINIIICISNSCFRRSGATRQTSGPCPSAQMSWPVSLVTRARTHRPPAARVPGPAARARPPFPTRPLPPGPPFPWATRQPSIRILRTSPLGLHGPSQVQVGASKSWVTGPVTESPAQRPCLAAPGQPEHASRRHCHGDKVDHDTCKCLIESMAAYCSARSHSATSPCVGCGPGPQH